MGTVRGERHPKSRLSDAEALEVKRRALLNEPYESIMRDYPVSRTTVSQLKHGHARPYLAVDIPCTRVATKGSRHHAAKLTERTAQEAYDLKGVMPCKDVARAYGVTGPTISRLWHGFTWTHVTGKRRSDGEAA